jgi:DHA2 family multidrug resistance protein
MTTMLSRGSQVHQAALVHNINPYNPEVQQRVQQLTHVMPGSGTIESQQAYGVIQGMVARQAMVLSYIDNFRMLAFLCVLCVPAVFLFKRVRARKGPVAMH